MIENRIYLDHAASTPLLPEVKEAIASLLDNEYGNPSSIHQEGRKARTIVEHARKEFANRLVASLGEIFFTGSATESNNLILNSLILSSQINHVICSPIEHPCIINTLKYYSKMGMIRLSFVRVDMYGSIDQNHLEELLNSDPESQVLVCAMWVNNEIGIIQDMHCISQLCQQANAWLLSDAVQAYGLTKIDVNTVPIDFLSLSAHKFHGPKGVGVLYVKSDRKIPPLLHGGGQERNMRAGTENILGIHAASVASKLVYESFDARLNKLVELRNYFKDQLIRLDLGVKFYDINGQMSPKILNVELPTSDKSAMLSMLLDIRGISASAGSACSSGTEKVSHVFQSLKGREDSYNIRFSMSPSNTKEEIDYTTKVLSEIYN